MRLYSLSNALFVMYLLLMPSVRGAIVDAGDMGVHYCRLYLDGKSFGSKLMGYSGNLMLHVFLKYTAYVYPDDWGGPQFYIKVKGSVSMEPLDPVTHFQGRNISQIKVRPLLKITSKDGLHSHTFKGISWFPTVSIIRMDDYFQRKRVVFLR
jgi:hypothetical protein